MSFLIGSSSILTNQPHKTETQICDISLHRSDNLSVKSTSQTDDDTDVFLSLQTDKATSDDLIIQRASSRANSSHISAENSLCGWRWTIIQQKISFVFVSCKLVYCSHTHTTHHTTIVGTFHRLLLFYTDQTIFFVSPNPKPTPDRKPVCRPVSTMSKMSGITILVGTFGPHNVV